GRGIPRGCPEAAAARGTRKLAFLAARPLPWARVPAVGRVSGRRTRSPGERMPARAVSSVASRRCLLLFRKHRDHHSLLLVHVSPCHLLDLLRRHCQRRLQVPGEGGGILREHLAVVELIRLSAEPP